LGVKRTSKFKSVTSAFDPFETLAPAQPRAIERKLGHFQYANLTRYDALSIALGRQ
jgi:hypothetical protein